MEREKSATQKALTNNLRLLALERNTTAVDLSQGIGISRASLFKYMEGNTSPSADAIAKIADYFEVSVDWLLGRSRARSVSEDMQTAVKVSGLNEAAMDAIAEATSTVCNDLPLRGALIQLLCSPLLKQVLYEFSRYKLSCYRLSSLKKSETSQEFSTAIAEHDERQAKDIAALRLQKLLFEVLNDIEKQGGKKWQD